MVSLIVCSSKYQRRTFFQFFYSVILLHFIIIIAYFQPKTMNNFPVSTIHHKAWHRIEYPAFWIRSNKEIQFGGEMDSLILCSYTDAIVWNDGICIYPATESWYPIPMDPGMSCLASRWLCRRPRIVLLPDPIQVFCRAVWQYAPAAQWSKCDARFLHPPWFVPGHCSWCNR